MTSPETPKVLHSLGKDFPNEIIDKHGRWAPPGGREWYLGPAGFPDNEDDLGVDGGEDTFTEEDDAFVVAMAEYREAHPDDAELRSPEAQEMLAQQIGALLAASK